MNRITKIIVAGALAVAFAAGGFASASGSAPEGYNGDRSGHPIAAQISPQVIAAGIVPQAGFVPITPCRAADTRGALAGKMSANTVRDFNITGNQGFEAQGGRAGGCGLPLSASAAVLSLTTTNTTGNSYLVGWPSGSAMPKATALSEQKGVNVTNESTLPMGNSGKVSMSSPGAATDLVVDIVGYYREPIVALVASNGSLSYGSSHVTGVQKLSTGWYRVKFNVNVYACAGEATSNYSADNISVNMESTSVLVLARDVTASGTPYVDSGFTLSVTC